jgi:hypothetical protein
LGILAITPLIGPLPYISSPNYLYFENRPNIFVDLNSRNYDRLEFWIGCKNEIKIDRLKLEFIALCDTEIYNITLPLDCLRIAGAGHDVFIYSGPIYVGELIFQKPDLFFEKYEQVLIFWKEPLSCNLKNVHRAGIKYILFEEQDIISKRERYVLFYKWVFGIN